MFYFIFLWQAFANPEDAMRHGGLELYRDDPDVERYRRWAASITSGTKLHFYLEIFKFIWKCNNTCNHDLRKPQWCNISSLKLVRYICVFSLNSPDSTVFLTWAILMKVLRQDVLTPKVKKSQSAPLLPPELRRFQVLPFLHPSPWSVQDRRVYYRPLGISLLWLWYWGKE